VHWYLLDLEKKNLESPVKRASAEKFSGGQWKNQDREIAPISLSLYYQWRVIGGALGMHLGLTSRERCITSSA